MNAASPSPSDPSDGLALPINSTGFIRMSSRKFSARARRLEVLSYRQHFNNVWQRIICDSFETPADAAVFFGVDPSTAENWFEGRNAPQGWGVAWLISHPETRAATLHALAGA